jgi:hypothetical protein
MNDTMDDNKKEEMDESYTITNRKYTTKRPTQYINQEEKKTTHLYIEKAKEYVYR